MKKMLLYCAIVTLPWTWILPVLSVYAATYTPPTTNRTKVDLSSQSWKFITSNTLTGAEVTGYNDASWAAVSIPHTWNSHADKTFYTNCWYRTHFTGSSNDTIGGKRFYVYFEAVTTVADVYLNGTLLGQHKGGYTAFIFDAANSRKDGDNVLAVKVNNFDNPGLPAQQAGWMHFGGIHRKVWSLITDTYNVDPTDYASSGVYITQSNVSTANANLSIKTMVRNYDATGKTFTVKNIVCDNSQTIVTTLQNNVTVNANSGNSIVITGNIPNPALWSMGSPDLYNVYTEVWVDGVLKDMVAQRIGLRYYSLTTNNFTINGVQKFLRGACLHEENEYKGNAVDSLTVKSQFDAVQDLGMNYVRLVHYPHPEFTYTIADELGIAISTETGDWGSGPDIRNADRDNNVKEMVKQKFNHPSVLFWCAGNEDSFAANVTRWAFIIDSIDGSKPVYFASNGANPPGVDFIAVNIYGGWYGGALTDFPQGDHYISESGAGGVVASHQDYKSATWTYDTWEPEEYQSLANEFKFNYLFNVNPAYVPLYSHWLLFDICDTKYKGMNSKGMLTYAGLPKDCYYIWKAKARPATPLVHICGKHWYLRTGERDVKVYSNRASITLSVNGINKGSKSDGAYTTTNGSVVNDVFFFDTVLSRGRNVVIAQDGAGNNDTAVIYFTGTAPDAPADNSEYITNLASGNANNPAYFINIPLQAQWPVYYQCDGNADNTFDSIPGVLTNARWIAARRQSDAALTTSLSFRINAVMTADADVFIMFTRQASVPAWITTAGFTNTNSTGRWRDNALNLVGYQLFKRTYTPGSTVSLSGSAIDFVVMVNRAGSSGIGSTPGGTLMPMKPSSFTFKTIGSNIIVPREIASGINSIAVYNLSGKLVRRIIGRKNIINLKKDFSVSNGAYIVRLEIMPVH